MKSMLQGGYLAVFEAKTRDELHAELKQFAGQLGFQTFAASAVVDRCLSDPEFITVDNTPAAYHQVYNDPDFAKRDPVMQHCKTTSVPIIWNQDTYLRAKQGEKWELQAPFGYRHGIAVALHLPRGRHFVLGVDRDQSLPRDAAELTRIVAAVQLFAAHAQEAAMRILLPEAANLAQPTLTPRELETLRWTMEGKTAWEIGRILGIAENTVIRHAHSATQKLGGANKHHAVVKALKIGLLG